MTIRWRWGPLRSLLALSPVLIGVPFISLKQHYGELSRFGCLSPQLKSLLALPEPLVDLWVLGTRTIKAYVHEMLHSVQIPPQGCRKSQKSISLALQSTYQKTLATELSEHLNMLLQTHG